MLPDLSVYEKFQTVTQGEIRYYEMGSGKPLLLLHGMGVSNSADTFRFMLESLASKHHVFALDALGFGGSSRVLANGPTFDVIVDGVREFMDRLGIAKANVVAHSAGGWFSGILAYESPNRFGKLVWIGAAGMNVKAIASVAGYKPPTLESITEENMASVYEGSELSAEMAAALAEPMLKHARAEGAFEGLKPLVGQMKDLDIRKSYLLQRRLPQIANPVLLLWGEKEMMEPYPTWIEEWESTGHDPGKSSKPWVSPNMRFELIPGATHFVHWERRSLVLDLIEEFLAE
jgi:pimeloyl-ACP methyl ester carboxylesterase